MGSVIGALAYSTASPGATSVARLPCARVSSIARTDSACAICNSRGLLCPVAAKEMTTTAAFMPHWFSLDMLGSCIFPLARRLVSAMAFVGTLIPIASPHGVVARVRSRRNAGKSSWKRAVSKSETVKARLLINVKLPSSLEGYISYPVTNVLLFCMIQLLLRQ